MSFQDLEPGGPSMGWANGKHDPSQSAAAGVFQIITAVSTFQRLVNTLRTPKDTPQLRERLHKTRLHIGQLVKDASAKFKQANNIDQQSEVSVSKKLADSRLAKDFEAVLKDFQKAQRLSAERETAYAPLVPQTGRPLSDTGTERDISSDRASEKHVLLAESRRQEALLVDNEIIFNEAIIDEREQGIHEIQQEINGVHEIVKDLAVLVHDQGTQIDDIHSNIENSVAATAQGKTQLVQTANTQKSNSSLLSKVIYMLFDNLLNGFSFFLPCLFSACYMKERKVPFSLR